MTRTILIAALVAAARPSQASAAEAVTVAPRATCSHVTVGRAVLLGGPRDARRVAQSAITVTCDPRATYHLRVRSDNGCVMHGPSRDVAYVVYGGRDFTRALDACGRSDESIAGTGSDTYLLRILTAALPLDLPPGAYRDDLRVEIVP